MKTQIERPKLTVLTDPIPCGGYFFSETVKNIAKYLRGRVYPPRKNFDQSRYSGHPTVTRSLVEGLELINASYNYNPRRLQEISDRVVVLSGIETLRQMIAFKRKGLIKSLYAGPNIVVFASDDDSILACPEVDWVITPCDWVIDLYQQDCPTLKGRFLAWPAGVDTRYWKVDPTMRCKKKILIFEKQAKGPVGPVQPYAAYLDSLGYQVSIIKYGYYTHSRYLKELQESVLMVGFVMDESQGIAWAEAWAADVPTLLWRNVKGRLSGRSYHCSTAPYLCEQNGAFFDDIEEFKLKIGDWALKRDRFSPREWVLKNMSDEVCATNLYRRVTGC
jgi:hypothetical protein